MDLRTATRKCANRDEARITAKKFLAAGWKIESGQEVEGGFELTATITVSDNCGRIPGKFWCNRCARTGQFITYTENGKPKGPGGICFRCDGKGHHTQADRRRNYGWDLHGFRHG